jgi:hypothetical protein
MAHLHLEWGVEAEPPGAARNKMQWSLGELQGGIDILDKVIEGEAKKTETD